VSALRARFSPEILPLLKAVDCLSTPAAEKLETLKTLSEYYPRDVDKDVLLS